MQCRISCHRDQRRGAQRGGYRKGSRADAAARDKDRRSCSDCGFEFKMEDQDVFKNDGLIPGMEYALEGAFCTS